MRKYFYTNGKDKIGPFTFEELRKQNLSRETKVWFYGLNNWTALTEIEEFKPIITSMPPSLPSQSMSSQSKEIKNINDKKNDTSKKEIEKRPTKSRRYIKSSILIIIISSIVLLIGYTSYNNQRNSKLYQKISSSSFETDVDFDFYVRKFYRDIKVYGIFPKKPKKVIIKFAKLDQLDDVTHIHGLSYGMNYDDRIEIYINPSTWESFNKPMRYFLMYHELSHDVLNVDDLKALPENKGKLMYPILVSYQSKTMDDFIESSHELFEQISAKQN
jgi:hypothetical protein